MPVIVNQLDAEITEPAEVSPETSVEPVMGNTEAADCFSAQMELMTERSERLKVD